MNQLYFGERRVEFEQLKSIDYNKIKILTLEDLMKHETPTLPPPQKPPYKLPGAKRPKKIIKRNYLNPKISTFTE